MRSIINVYMLKYHYRVARVQVFVNFIISSGDILLHSKILLCTSAKFIGKRKDREVTGA